MRIVNRCILSLLPTLSILSLAPWSSASASISCPSPQQNVTCSDGETRRPGDLMMGFTTFGNAMIVGIHPATSQQFPDVYMHSQFPAAYLGDLVPVPENPNQMLVGAELDATGKRMTIGRLDRCGVLVDPKYGDFTAFYGLTGLQHLLGVAGLAIDPTSGDIFMPEFAWHPQVTSGLRPFAHRHFRVPHGGGPATYFYAGGTDDYGPGDSRHSGGSAFNLDGDLYQSGYGQESLSVITAEQLDEMNPQEVRIDHDPNQHNSPGYRGLHRMVVDGTGRYIFATDLSYDIVRIDTQHDYERTVFLASTPGRSFKQIAIDTSNRIWTVDTSGVLHRTSNIYLSYGVIEASYDVASAIGLPGQAAVSLAIYGVNEPVIQSACE